MNSSFMERNVFRKEDPRMPLDHRGKTFSSPSLGGCSRLQRDFVFCGERSKVTQIDHLLARRVQVLWQLLKMVQRRGRIGLLRVTESLGC